MDNQKLDKAIIYVDRIANGFNPVNNHLIENDSVFNNPNVIRCMYFIKDVLKEVQKNGGVIGKKVKVQKEPFDFQILDKFTYIEDKSITKLLWQIDAYVENLTPLFSSNLLSFSSNCFTNVPLTSPFVINSTIFS